MKEDSENAKLLPKTASPKENLKESSSDSDYRIVFYVLLILVIFGVLLFFFFYIHYGSYKVEVLVNENGK